MFITILFVTFFCLTTLKHFIRSPSVLSHSSDNLITQDTLPKRVTPVAGPTVSCLSLAAWLLASAVNDNSTCGSRARPPSSELNFRVIL